MGDLRNHRMPQPSHNERVLIKPCIIAKVHFYWSFALHVMNFLPSLIVVLMAEPTEGWADHYESREGGIEVVAFLLH